MRKSPPHASDAEIRSVRLGRTKVPATDNIASFAFGCDWRMPFLSADLSSRRKSTVSIGDLRSAGGFWKAYQTDLESIQCAWSKRKVLVGCLAEVAA